MDGRILNTVVDSLDVRVHRSSPISQSFSDLVLDFRDYIEVFEFGNDPLYIQIDGVPFRLHHSGSRPYEFILINPTVCDIRIWNPDKWDSKTCRQTGQLYFNFRSLFLQRFGVEGARKLIEAASFFFFKNPSASSFGSYNRISRLDLACDVEMTGNFSLSELDNFVYRATKTEVNDTVLDAKVDEFINGVAQYQTEDAEFLNVVDNFIKQYLRDAHNDLISLKSSKSTRIILEHRKLQSVYFGRFGSKLYARIYNKLAEIVSHQKLYMLKTYKESGWDGKKPIYRVEFSVSGDFLKEFRVCENDEVILEDCRDLDLLESFIKSLWRYLTESWLTHRERSEDSNVWRWNFSSFWRAVSGAWGELNALGIRCRDSTITIENEHLYRMIRGCAVSVAARMYSDDSVDARTVIYEAVALMLAESEFFDEMEAKALRLGFDDASLSAGIRSEVMKRGKGS